MENKFIRAEEVAQELSVSKPYAYKLIRQLNKELKSMGYHTIAGKCPIQFFKQKFYGLEIGGDNA
jgi:Mn-dependent DtxR family transcriptional regulator